MSAGARLGGLLALTMALGCTGRRAPTPSAPAPSSSALGGVSAPTCPPLPPVRPKDFSARYAFSVLPIGGERMSEELRVGADECQNGSGTCPGLNQTELDGLYQAFREQGFDQITASARAAGEGPSPHEGALTVAARWDGRECVLSDDLSTRLDSRSMGSLFQLRDVMVKTVEAARARVAKSDGG